MALYPPAIKKLIPPGPNDPRITARAVILHIAVSEASSLYGWFNGPSGGIESHFYIRRDGTVEQYRDTAFEADANEAANRFALSVETQGMEYGEWTPQQVRAIKALCSWANKVHGIPLTTVKSAYGSGIGYHTQFPGVWDTRGATCPGPDRKRQFAREIVPWLSGGSPVEVGGSDKWTPTGGLSTKDIQELVGVTTDGDYGPATTSAVKELQQALDLTADGLWGPTTEGAVMSLIEKIDAIAKDVKELKTEQKRTPARVWAHRINTPGSVKKEFSSVNPAYSAGGLMAYNLIDFYLKGRSDKILQALEELES